ncbi:hypothetical protein D3C81_1179050 [compost metagenome]
MLNALRAEHWLQGNPQVPQRRYEQIKGQIRDAFYVDTPQRKQQVLGQAREVCWQTVGGGCRGARNKTQCPRAGRPWNTAETHFSLNFNCAPSSAQILRTAANIR